MLEDHSLLINLRWSFAEKFCLLMIHLLTVDSCWFYFHLAVAFLGFNSCLSVGIGCCFNDIHCLLRVTIAYQIYFSCSVIILSKNVYLTKPCAHRLIDVVPILPRTWPSPYFSGVEIKTNELYLRIETNTYVRTRLPQKTCKHKK